MLFQICTRKRPRRRLDDGLLAIFRRELVEFISQARASRENGCAVRCLVDDMDHMAVCCSILGEDAGNHFSRRLDVGDLELTLGVFVLGVDDDEGGVTGAGCGGWCAEDLAEREGGHFVRLGLGFV